MLFHRSEKLFFLFSFRFMLSLDQWKKSKGKQNDNKTMRWEKTNFMAFSWLYFLRKLFCLWVCDTPNTKLSLFMLLPSRSLYWKIMSFVQGSKIYIGFHFIFFLVSRIYFFLQYSGTNAEFTKADTVIFRTDIYNLTSGRKEYNFKRTLKYDSKWLDSKYFKISVFYLSIVEPSKSNRNSKVNLCSTM